ncbi:hypothetical protein FVE85_3595 [Porphyridium purpureum]|uniref:Uncharacterized protein n=1 Tax=Porphyridium purpureum TaxID=35688 RepID=A0A5J4YP29_PORPP|nr:hypothetical protein FVE85_3595 [Porphyridium purpureum]|eukprot:POR1086..scf249_10
MLKCAGSRCFRILRITRATARRGIHSGRPEWEATPVAPASGPPLDGPFYAIVNGRHQFRGVVLRKIEAEELVKRDPISMIAGQMSPFAHAMPTETLKEAIDFCSGGRGANEFFAFRHGLRGARGIVVKPSVFYRVSMRARARSFEVRVFDNTTQALIFCEQAGTMETDWESMEKAVSFLARNPQLHSPALLEKFVVKRKDASLPSGPLPITKEQIDSNHQGAQRSVAESVVRFLTSRPVTAMAHEVVSIAAKLDVQRLNQISDKTRDLLGLMQRLHVTAVRALEAKAREEDERRTRECARRALEEASIKADEYHAIHAEAYIHGMAIDCSATSCNAAAALYLVQHLSGKDGIRPVHVHATRLFESSEHMEPWMQSSDDVNHLIPNRSSDLLEVEALLLTLNYFILHYLDNGTYRLERLTLRTKSKYCASRCNTYLPKWRDKGWKMSYKVKHQELWQAVDTRLLLLKSLCEVTIEWTSSDDQHWDQAPFRPSTSDLRLLSDWLCEQDPQEAGKRAEGALIPVSGLDFATRGVWSDSHTQSFDYVHVDASHTPKGLNRAKASLGVHFGIADSRNVAALCPSNLTEVEGSYGVELLAAACGLDQILRFTLAGSPHVEPKLNAVTLFSDFRPFAEQLAEIDACWTEGFDLAKTGMSPLSGRFSAIWIVMYVRILLIRYFRPLIIKWKPRETNEAAHELALVGKDEAYDCIHNQRIVNTVGAHVQSTEHHALDMKLIAFLLQIPKVFDATREHLAMYGSELMTSMDSSAPSNDDSAIFDSYRPARGNEALAGTTMDSEELFHAHARSDDDEPGAASDADWKDDFYSFPGETESDEFTDEYGMVNDESPADPLDDDASDMWSYLGRFYDVLHITCFHVHHMRLAFALSSVGAVKDKSRSR